jgi:hypothetical protein
MKHITLARLKTGLYKESDPRTNALCWATFSDDKELVVVDFIDPVINMYCIFMHLSGHYNASDFGYIDRIITQATNFHPSRLQMLEPQDIIKYRNELTA